MKTMTAIAAALVCAAALAQTPAASAEAAQPERTPMQKIDDILTASKAFFLATVDGDQPKLRPLGAHHVVDGKVWLGVGEFKNVYRQLAANPKCEFVALQPDGKWLRWTGRASFAEGAERERLEEIFLNAMPYLRRIYDKSPGKRMMCFTLADSRAELIPTMPPGEILLDDASGASAEWDKVFPKSDKVEHSKVSFRNRYGITLVADLYAPMQTSKLPNLQTSKLPALAVSGPFGAVKEQVSGLYAMRLAERGFLTVAFDPSYTGESGGEPRNIASPDINTEDFLAAVDYLSTRDDVDADRIGIVGICGWGGMAVNAAALDPRIKATVASTMYDMTRVTANGYNDADDSKEKRDALRKALAEERTREARTGAARSQPPLPAPEDLAADTPQFVKEYVDFYKTPRGFHKRSVGSNLGWRSTGCQSFLNQPLLAYANEIGTPVLLVHGEKAHSRYFSEGAFEKMTGQKPVFAPGEYTCKRGNKELLLVPGAVHTALYDERAGVIPWDRIAAFFRENLK